MATVGDAALLARLQDAFDTEFGAEPADIDVLARRYALLLADEDGFAVLAESAGAATGFGTVTLRPTIYYDGPLAVLDELYVAPALRDRGIGSELLNAVIDEVRRRRGGGLHINVDEIDHDTRRFYERHGFVNIEPGNDYRMLLYLRDL
ncbi:MULTISPECIES: GNAT family N-acetyltransferase [unclassified Gordonia (in: high G+C Gram-positive bacteria)]|uniref:GNAT family N-acetyltransferase n=1 Tax=unclassified Gordonia (in: high G+C Gram-positive bacteria) TaxID=2657482 RepID=UPI002000379E|nr:GNAT family N-acetyltransferase [Gordonia sp. PP30]UQE77053.1 GNAT family N-acetyltransferase [Gordonia sp. PP30]